MATDQQQQKTRLLVFRVLTIVGLGLMVAAYFSPMWWVSLKAVNYPEETFPDGIRIHMHWTGVENGCTGQERAEIADDEGLDCVEEMNTINHYIGMEPIERGAQREFAAAPYLFTAFGIMLVVMLFYSGPLWWVLAVPAILAPVIFVADFAFWLWWFGHNLKEWAAFTEKPFMPTVLGEGLVAQFSTFSYPHYGMALSAMSGACLALAVLIRRKQLQEQGGA
jgi:hypothetical protein